MKQQTYIECQIYKKPLQLIKLIYCLLYNALVEYDVSNMNRQTNCVCAYVKKQPFPIYYDQALHQTDIVSPNYLIQYENS